MCTNISSQVTLDTLVLRFDFIYQMCFFFIIIIVLNHEGIRNIIHTRDDPFTNHSNSSSFRVNLPTLSETPSETHGRST